MSIAISVSLSSPFPSSSLFPLLTVSSTITPISCCIRCFGISCYCHRWMSPLIHWILLLLLRPPLSVSPLPSLPLIMNTIAVSTTTNNTSDTSSFSFIYLCHRYQHSCWSYSNYFSFYIRPATATIRVVLNTSCPFFANIWLCHHYRYYCCSFTKSYIIIVVPYSIVSVPVVFVAATVRPLLLLLWLLLLLLRRWCSSSFSSSRCCWCCCCSLITNNLPSLSPLFANRCYIMISPRVAVSADNDESGDSSSSSSSFYVRPVAAVVRVVLV